MAETFEGAPQAVEAPSRSNPFNEVYNTPAFSAPSGSTDGGNRTKDEPSHLEFGASDSLYGPGDGGPKPTEREQEGRSAEPSKQAEGGPEENKERPAPPLTPEQQVLNQERMRLLTIMVDALRDVTRGRVRPQQ